MTAYGPPSAHDITAAILLGVAWPVGVTVAAALGIHYRRRLIDLLDAAGDRLEAAVGALLARWDAFRGVEQHHGRHEAVKLPAAPRTPPVVAIAPVAQWPQPLTPLDQHFMRHLPDRWQHNPAHVAYVREATAALREKWRSEEPTGAITVGGGR